MWYQSETERIEADTAIGRSLWIPLPNTDSRDNCKVGHLESPRAPGVPKNGKAEIACKNTVASVELVGSSQLADRSPHVVKYQS